MCICSRNIWEKVHRMWSTVYSTPSLLDQFEWFLKADDDTFVSTEVSVVVSRDPQLF